MPDGLPVWVSEIKARAGVCFSFGIVHSIVDEGDLRHGRLFRVKR